jgi:hypothetical protein
MAMAREKPPICSVEHTDANLVHVIGALERYNQLRKQRSDLKHFLPGIMMYLQSV